MSTESKYTKWSIWEVHQVGFPDPPSYIPLPQYGPWDTELEARHMAELLTRLNPQPHALTAREFGLG
jgi:hypothetical protein